MDVLCIVQARMGSERLPGKVIKPILGKPMILYTLNRLNKSKHIDDVILATSTDSKEEPLVEIVEENNFRVFRGHESNVLKRYKDASDSFDSKIIIRVTGDCPLIDPVIVDNAVTYFKMNNYDYVRLDVPETFIRGFDVEIFTKDALNKAYDIVMNLTNVTREKEENKHQLEMYQEHVTYYMYKNPEEFKIGYLKGNDFYNKDYRLCVDTKKDFELVEKIYDHFKNEYVSSKDVIKYLDDNKEIAQINKEINQKKM